MMYLRMPGSGPRDQWQAQEPPQAVPEEEADEPEDDPAAAGEADEAVGEPPEPDEPDAPSPAAAGAAAAVAAAPVEPPRKSVAYQPDPFSWKPAAVTCFEKLSAPQAGQTVSGASDSFCSTSLAWPQAPHR